MRSFGVTTDEDLVDELDDLKREWDRHEAGTIHRTDVAREALAIGVEVLQHDEFKPAGGQYASQERRAIVRQALMDHFDDE